jgi:hypothetical protein
MSIGILRRHDQRCRRHVGLALLGAITERGVKVLKPAPFARLVIVVAHDPCNVEASVRFRHRAPILKTCLHLKGQFVTMTKKGFG